MTKRAKLKRKVDLAEPRLADEIHLVGVNINWRDEIFVLTVALIDTDVEPPVLVEERPIHIGFHSCPLDFSQLEEDLMALAVSSGVLPVSSDDVE